MKIGSIYYKYYIVKNREKRSRKHMRSVR